MERMQMNTVKLATCDWLILSRRRGSTPAVTGSAIRMMLLSQCSFASAWPHPVPVPSTPPFAICAVRGCTHNRTKLNAWLRAEQSASSTNHKLNQMFFFLVFGGLFSTNLYLKQSILWNTNTLEHTKRLDYVTLCVTLTHKRKQRTLIRAMHDGA